MAGLQLLEQFIRPELAVHLVKMRKTQLAESRFRFMIIDIEQHSAEVENDVAYRSGSHNEAFTKNKATMVNSELFAQRKIFFLYIPRIRTHHYFKCSGFRNILLAVIVKPQVCF